MAGACVVVFRFGFKISSFVRDSSQQRHNGGPQRADRTDRAILRLITHCGLVASLPPVVLRYRFLKRMLKFGRHFDRPFLVAYLPEAPARRGAFEANLALGAFGWENVSA